MNQIKVTLTILLFLICSCGNGQKPDLEKLDAQASNELKQKNYSQAIQICDQIIALEDNHWKAFYTRALSYNYLNEYDKAEADYTSAIKYHKDFFALYLNRGSLYLNLQEYKKALSDFKIAAEMNPTNIESLNNMGLAYENLRDYTKAIESYDKAIGLSPTTGYLYYNKGNCYAAQIKFDTACEIWQQALDYGLDDPDEIENIRKVCSISEHPLK